MNLTRPLEVRESSEPNEPATLKSPAVTASFPAEPSDWMTESDISKSIDLGRMIDSLLLFMLLGSLTSFRAAYRAVITSTMYSLRSRLGWGLFSGMVPQRSI